MIKVRADKAIEGINVLNKEIKFSALADDITNFSINIRSVMNLLAELEVFRLVSGLFCNLSKCEIMALGNGEYSVITYNNEELKWVTIVKITGIYFSQNYEQSVVKNFENLVERVQNQLKLYKPMYLSILGKITVVKTCAVSQAIYPFNMINPPENIIKDLNSEIYRFIWNDKTHKIKRNALIADYEDGGLKGPDLHTMINVQRLMWVKRFLYSQNHNWKNIMLWQLNKLKGASIF